MMPNDSPTIPVPPEPGIPARAPQSLREYARGIDLLTGGLGRPRPAIFVPPEEE